MNHRLNYLELAPEGYKAMAGLERFLRSCGLERSLLHLVKMRASQINGCAFCIDMHWKDARHEGESEQRLYGLDAWEEAPYYTDRERAAFAWTEAVTLVTTGHVSDAVFETVRQHFSDEEVVSLTYAIATINAWNRLAIAMRSPAGLYEPGKFVPHTAEPV